MLLSRLPFRIQRVMSVQRLTTACMAPSGSAAATSGDIHSPGFSIKGEAIEGRPAYLDFQATTPLDPRVLDAMMPFLTEKYGNPHSRTHSFGWESEKSIETARDHVAKLIGE